MALVVLLRKPPEHGSIVHIRFRATVPVEEKEIAVTVNGGRASLPCGSPTRAPTLHTLFHSLEFV